MYSKAVGSHWSVKMITLVAVWRLDGSTVVVKNGSEEPSQESVTSPEGHSGASRGGQKRTESSVLMGVESLGLADGLRMG